MPDTVKENAPEILAEVLKKRGMKQVFLARKIGISPSSMSQLMHGSKKFTGDIAMQIGKALNISDSIFLTESYSKREEKIN